ncbi:23727_t:CDS:2 [Gigaspora margarita]|uniref:23727_t:CDS:1 n=1 Tax=Gigaspora margarita TaxID=4874 RepID=A0ABN7UMF0_GIGMA|nr:23727_t:CDS:2 [Gigaspora margarita]
MSSNIDNNPIVTSDTDDCSIFSSSSMNKKSSGIPANMKLYLANEYSSCPQYKQKYWQDKIENQHNNYQRTSKTKHCKSTYLVNTNDSESLTNDLVSLSIDRQNLLDHAVLKAWVGCGIFFELIDNPFMQDLFMRLNPAYHPPKRTTLSGQILEKEIQTNYESSLTNNRVKNIINNEDFFINCHHINQIIEPIKICIGRLEAQTATLADCYINILKLVAAIYQLPEQTFRLASLIASSYWKALRHDEAECIELLVEFRKFIHNKKPYKAKFDSQKESSLI